MGTDYYKLLGVDKNADENEIKKAYKKMVSIESYLLAFDVLLTFCTSGSEMASRP